MAARDKFKEILLAMEDDTTDSIMKGELRQQIEKILQKLTPREREILQMRFGKRQSCHKLKEAVWIVSPPKCSRKSNATSIA